MYNTFSSTRQTKFYGVDERWAQCSNPKHLLAKDCMWEKENWKKNFLKVHQLVGWLHSGKAYIYKISTKLAQYQKAYESTESLERSEKDQSTLKEILENPK